MLATDRLPDEPLDRRQLKALLGRGQRDRVAAVTGSGGATDAVHVVLRGQVGKQLLLADHRHRMHDLPDCGHPGGPHVEHAVGFVQDDDLNVGEPRLVATEVVEEPARGSDEQIEAGGQPVLLRLKANAAKDDRAPQPQMRAVPPGHLADLCGQLSSRAEHERARVARRRATGEVLQDRQQERRGLARAGLRTRNEIAAVEHDRDGTLLDRCRVGIARARPATDDISDAVSRTRGVRDHVRGSTPVRSDFAR